MIDVLIFYLSAWSSNSPWRSQCHTVCVVCAIIAVTWQQPAGISEAHYRPLSSEADTSAGSSFVTYEAPWSFDSSDCRQQLKGKRVFFWPWLVAGTLLFFYSSHMSQDQYDILILFKQCHSCFLLFPKPNQDRCLSWSKIRIVLVLRLYNLH